MNTGSCHPIIWKVTWRFSILTTDNYSNGILPTAPVSRYRSTSFCRPEPHAADNSPNRIGVNITENRGSERERDRERKGADADNLIWTALLAELCEFAVQLDCVRRTCRGRRLIFTRSDGLIGTETWTAGVPLTRREIYIPLTRRTNHRDWGDGSVTDMGLLSELSDPAQRQKWACSHGSLAHLLPSAVDNNLQ